MKVRWRQHEIILVNTISAILLISYLWRIHNTSTEQFSTPFENNHVAFNLYKNVVLPDLGMGLLVYLSYMWLNLFTIPRLLFPKKFEGGTSKITISLSKISLQGMAKKILIKYSWLLIQIFLIIIVLGTALNIAVYFKHLWQFEYPGFSVFFNKNNPGSQMDIYGSYWFVFVLISLYFLYLAIRESIIQFIEKSGNKRDFLALICNQVTICIVYYVVLPVFLQSFNMIYNNSFFLAYYLITPSLFFMYMSNMYWLFPQTRGSRFFSKKIISRLVVSSLICALPFAFFEHRSAITTYTVGFAVLLFCITPITWLYYQTRKDKILQLVGTQKELIKSKTDLQFLRSQINPHFLFNILNTLYGMALQENAGNTATGIQKLGDMMRFMLYENNLDFIEMNKEIAYLKNYIALQKLRTQSSSSIIIEDNISGHECHHKIAPMLFIPFVENAFKHGISLKEKSWIKINLECSEKDILFEVRNSVHAKQNNDPEQNRSGIGFANVIERLKLIYPGRFQISFNKDEKEFFVQLAIQPTN